MTQPTQKLINDLISKHRALLLDELKKVDLDLKQAYKLYITDKYKLPVEALTQINYLDAYISLANLANYTPVEKKDWRAVDYLDRLYDSVLQWVDSNQEFYDRIKSEAQTCNLGASWDDICKSLLVVAINKEDKHHVQQLPNATREALPPPSGEDPGPKAA